MPASVSRRRFTVGEYYRMAEVGILRPGERVERIEGEIIGMAAIGSRHAATVSRLTRLLVPLSGHARACARIPEYWIVNLPGDRIEVHRDPNAAGYRDVRSHHRSAVLQLLAFADLAIPAADILP